MLALSIQMAFDSTPDHGVQDAEGEVALRKVLVVLMLVLAAMETGCPKNHWFAAWAIGNKVAHQSTALENGCSSPWPDVTSHLCAGAVFK